MRDIGFIVGEWVERRSDGMLGVVEIVDTDSRLYRIRLRTWPVAEREAVVGDEDDWVAYYRVHAHVTRSSADCDGRYESGRVDRPSAEERCSEFGHLMFQERVVASVVNVLSMSGTLHVSENGVEWSEATEEGYLFEEVEWCSDDRCLDGTEN